MPTLDEQILNAVLKIMLEKKEEGQDPEESKKPSKPKPKREAGSKIVTKGAFGSGTFSSMFRSMETRAVKDPRGLLKDLGVASASGGSDLEKASSVWEQAISNNETMGEAFSEPQGQKIGQKDEQKEGTAVSPKAGDVSARDATKYLYLTLLAAENAGVLNFKEGVAFVPRRLAAVPTIVGL